MSKKILVTGGAGFIGSHLVKKLIDLNYQVVVADNLNDYYEPKLKKDRLEIFLGGYKFDFYKADIADFTVMQKIFLRHKFDAICHFAAQAGVRHSLANPWLYEETNIKGTLNLLELARKNKIKKFILASSSSVYGGNVKMPFSEKDRVNQPVSFYATSKRSAELMAYTYHHLYKLNIICLRFFTVYGPWGRPDMAYFKFADLIRQSKPIDIYNNGEMSRDFTYIDDIINGVIAAVEKDFDWEIFNLGNNKPEKLGRLISLLEENLDKKASKNFMPLQPGDVISTRADIDKAQNLLGYKPKIILDEGIKKFIDWYKDYYKLN